MCTDVRDGCVKVCLVLDGLLGSKFDGPLDGRFGSLFGSMVDSMSFS